VSGVPSNLVAVTDAGSGHFEQRITIGRHVLSADEPQSNGGQDMGPSPYEYVLAGLGACTAITLRMYVARHNWALRQTRVELEHEKILAADGASKIDHFRRTIYLEGDLTEEQRLRLFQVAEKCPVSETLRHAAVVESKLAGALSLTQA
jgi:putative redox protein